MGVTARALLVGATAVVVTCTIGVASASKQAPGDFFFAFSDTAIPTVADARAYLQASRGKICGPRVSGSLGAARALKGLDTFLTRKAGRKAMRALERSRAVRSRRGASLGVGAATSRKPELGLAALLAAHEREPREPLHLINAAVIATWVGKAREALGLLDRADLLVRNNPIGPMGISVRALSLNARGFTLIALGRFGEAERVLRRAVAADRLLVEARANLAAALLCRGQADAGARMYQSATRRREISDVPLDGGGTVANPAEAFDLSQGVEAVLPQIKYPLTPEAGAASAAEFGRLEDRTDAEADQLSSRASQVQTRVRPGLGLTVVRRLYIMSQGANVASTPEVRRLYQTMVSRFDPGLAFIESWQNEFGARSAQCSDPGSGLECMRAWCPPVLRERHERWLQIVRQMDADVRAWAREYYRVATGMAANLADPAAKAWLDSTATYFVLKWYARLLQHTFVWTGFEAGTIDFCTSGTGESGAETSEKSLPSAGPCPPGLKAIKFTLRVPVPPPFPSWAISVQCEKIEIEASRSLNPLDRIESTAVFGSGTYTFSSGKVTLFAGLKSSVPGLGGKGGVYVTLTPGGHELPGGYGVTDVGIKGTIGGDVGSSTGPVRVSVGGSASGEVSLVPWLL